LPDTQRVENSLALDPASADYLLLQAYHCYAALTQTATHPNHRAEALDAEPNLGGNLLYAGELDVHGCAMVIAGNVAGCATLAATANSAAQKQAIREGTVDFVVTSLDEALRILKNEVRKKATVAVCVGLAPSDIEREMLERGVLPDLVAKGAWDENRGAAKFGVDAREVRCIQPDRSQAFPDRNGAFLDWRVAQASIRWMSKLDAIALECFRSDVWARRWIRLSPRYCGRSAQGQRLLYCDPDEAALILDGFENAVRDGAIATEISGTLRTGGKTKLFRFFPA
jgi:urocanate hydratase